MASKGLGLSQNDLEKSIEAAPFLYTKRARGLRTGRALFFAYTSMMTGRIMGLRLVFL